MSDRMQTERGIKNIREMGKSREMTNDVCSKGKKKMMTWRFGPDV